MSSPPSTERHGDVRTDLASAAEQRAHQNTPADLKHLAHEHEVKQAFRRLIDPGITRPNNAEAALEALKTLAILSDNLLREPDNTKFQQFKPTNQIIKKRLVDVKGALEYAVALGFQLKVEYFQPLYVFNNRHLEDLQLGNGVLKETLSRETEKLEKAKQSKMTEKEVREAAAEKVKLNYLEDRMEKKLKDEREAQARATAAQRAGGGESTMPMSSPSASRIPQGGLTLSGQVEPSVESLLPASSPTSPPVSRIPQGGVTLGGHVEPPANPAADSPPTRRSGYQYDDEE